jgi:NTE family protein
VQINPRERTDSPRSAAEILNRLNEISFNSPLVKELRIRWVRPTWNARRR